eukprot:CAMPEP_0197072624 /NCGR_PEP_ID=MMETSP1384-20130603/210190_1 /TAXON_ID=29189 /ORGANISM="Ammonia sp." /LENGTH=673 /DNA_ID=CAMNT_0042511445 /DNA_START=199 /DNA_END=2220 /DNA_ORIENTATION=-
MASTCDDSSDHTQNHNQQAQPDHHHPTEQQSMSSGDDTSTTNKLRIRTSEQESAVQTTPPRQCSTEKQANSLPRVGSANSVSSMASISSFTSSNTNQHNEICENLGYEARSTHSFSHSIEDRLILPQHTAHSHSHHANNHNSNNNNNEYPLLLPHGQWPLPMNNSIASPSAKPASPSSSPVDGNGNDDEPVMMPHLLSPHISALTKLHTNNLSQRELSISPQDPQSNQLQHQDIKYRHAHTHRPNEHTAQHGHTAATQSNDSPRARSSYSSLKNALWSSLQTVNSYMPYTSSSTQSTIAPTHNDEQVVDEHDDVDEKKQEADDQQIEHDQQIQQQLYNESALHSIINTPKFMNDALKNALWSSLQTVNSYMPYTSSSTQSTVAPTHNDEQAVDEHDDVDEKKQEADDQQIEHDQQIQQQLYNESALHSIINTPKFMNDALAMYGELDHALQNINHLKQRQLQQIKTLQQRRRRKRNNEEQSNEQSNEQCNDQPLGNEGFESLDVNESVVDVMKTLISSTTEMGSFFASATNQCEVETVGAETDDGGADANDEESRSTSIIGRALNRLSSSIAYMSYISVSTVTPFIYNMVEAVLVELYSTIKDIIEFYDPDAKNNILWRIIHKMDEIMQAIRGLLALSDCFYEISSDQEDDDAEDADAHSYSFFSHKKKEKKD